MIINAPLCYILKQSQGPGIRPVYKVVEKLKLEIRSCRVGSRWEFRSQHRQGTQLGTDLNARIGDQGSEVAKQGGGIYLDAWHSEVLKVRTTLCRYPCARSPYRPHIWGVQKPMISS